MQLSPSKRGYDFQHRIKDIFAVSLGFEAREEDSLTGTDICLTYPPINLAVECKCVEAGVSIQHVKDFDERLKKLYADGRPSLGIIVATNFQQGARELCKEKNILCITEQQIKDVRNRKRESMPSTSIPISSKIRDLLYSLKGLCHHWLGHIYADPISIYSPFVDSLVENKLAMVKEQIGDYLKLDYTEDGIRFFTQLKTIYSFLASDDIKHFDNEPMIVDYLTDVLCDFSENEYTCFDKMMLMAMGIIFHIDRQFKLTPFAQMLLKIISINSNVQNHH